MVDLHRRDDEWSVDGSAGGSAPLSAEGGAGRSAAGGRHRGLGGRLPTQASSFTSSASRTLSLER